MTAGSRIVPLYLAPMAGVTNQVFRRICRADGADVLTSEFVSADGIFHRNKRTQEYLDFQEEERPFGVQLFGGDASHLAEGARLVIEWKNPDFIDLNFGCPVNKVVSKFGGASVLRDLRLLEKIAKEVVKAAGEVCVTAKIRIGWNESSVNALETAKILEEAGIGRIAVHGRTKEQGYGGVANWEVIGQVAASVKVPVIGNGDIACPEDALLRLRETGVAGLMIGRAAMNRPWLFSQIQAAMRGEPIPADPSLKERWQRVIAHCRAEIAWRGDENFAMRSMRSRLMAYSRGMPQGRHLREALGKVVSLDGLSSIADAHAKAVFASGAER